MSDDEIIEVVKAHKEGKKIQFRPAGSKTSTTPWVDADERGPNWNFEFMDYRVSPEPRKPQEWWIDMNASNGPWRAYSYRPSYESGSLAEKCLVRVREVIE